MEIRPARHEDLPEIIELLKLSLGEGLIPKSEGFFRWKHEQNPFGASIMLVAREEGRLVGLRTFMRWAWVAGSDRVETVRAVDTATDPAFQGRGIFRTLTLKAVDHCREQGFSHVFNSPNSQSRPGYLKMGWQVTGRMPLYFSWGSLVPSRSLDAAQERMNRYGVGEALQGLAPDWQMRPHAVEYHTPLDRSYLSWRYADCPIVRYGAVIEPGSFGFVFRVKSLNRFVELRLCELWSEKAAGRKTARKALNQVVRTIRPAIISCAASPLWDPQRFRPLGLYGPLARGPITTLRPLAQTDLSAFERFHHWKPSIGSMELF